MLYIVLQYISEYKTDIVSVGLSIFGWRKLWKIDPKQLVIVMKLDSKDVSRVWKQKSEAFSETCLNRKK